MNISYELSDTILWISNSMTGETLLRNKIDTDCLDFKEGKIITIDQTNYEVIERYTTIDSCTGTIIINLRVIGN